MTFYFLIVTLKAVTREVAVWKCLCMLFFSQILSIVSEITLTEEWYPSFWAFPLQPRVGQLGGMFPKGEGQGDTCHISQSSELSPERHCS